MDLRFRWRVDMLLVLMTGFLGCANGDVVLCCAGGDGEVGYPILEVREEVVGSLDGGIAISLNLDSSCGVKLVVKKGS